MAALELRSQPYLAFAAADLSTTSGTDDGVRRNSSQQSYFRPKAGATPQSMAEDFIDMIDQLAKANGGPGVIDDDDGEVFDHDADDDDDDIYID